MSIAAVIAAATADIGYMECPEYSNMTKYGEWYGMNGQPWCVMALAYWFNFGNELNAFCGGNRTASCTQLKKWYVKQHRWFTNNYQVGDIAIMTFSNNKEIQHCGLIIQVNTNGSYVTIEGNTSTGTGSQDNGGCVARRIRYDANIIGVCRPQYTQEETVMPDYETHWAKEYIEKAKSAGIVKGVGNGNVVPDKQITRAEAITMIARLMEKLESCGIKLK